MLGVQVLINDPEVLPLPIKPLPDLLQRVTLFLFPNCRNSVYDNSFDGC